MSPLLLLITSSTLLGAAVLVATGGGPSAEQVPAPSPTDWRTLAPRAATAAGAAALVLVLTGWLLPAAATGVGGWVVAVRWQRRAQRSVSDVEMTEALASWIESLRDVLVAGDQPVGAISTTIRSCPPVLRPHVRRLSSRLEHLEAGDALRRFADDVDDPLGDLVGAGLTIAIDRGARTVGVLTSLAEQARHQADRRRIVAAERAPVRREVGLLSLIMAALIAALFVFGRSDYLDAYDTADGQLFLTVCLIAYGLLLLRVQALAHYERPARFLSAASSGPVATTAAPSRQTDETSVARR